MKISAASILVICAACTSVGAYDPDRDIKYLLYTRKNPTVPQRIYKNDQASLLGSNFNLSNPVKFTIHGWMVGASHLVNTALTSAFLKDADVNMIVIDWQKGSFDPTYIIAFGRVPKTGASISGFYDWLNSLGVPFSNMHVLGHSLGGHVAGNSGRYTKLGKVEYITGLDPGSLFWNANSPRIRSTDGNYVEIIHTNNFILGVPDPMGHNDFYVNGGMIMPGCDIDPICSHCRAILYMAESIDNENFRGTLCNDWDEAVYGSCKNTTKLHMGGTRAKPAIGLFQLRTNANPPFAQG